MSLYPLSDISDGTKRGSALTISYAIVTVLGKDFQGREKVDKHQPNIYCQTMREAVYNRHSIKISCGDRRTALEGCHFYHRTATGGGPNNLPLMVKSRPLVNQINKLESVQFTFYPNLNILFNLFYRQLTCWYTVMDLKTVKLKTNYM